MCKAPRLKCRQRSRPVGPEVVDQGAKSADEVVLNHVWSNRDSFVSMGHMVSAGMFAILTGACPFAEPSRNGPPRSPVRTLRHTGPLRRLCAYDFGETLVVKMPPGRNGAVPPGSAQTFEFSRPLHRCPKVFRGFQQSHGAHSRSSDYAMTSCTVGTSEHRVCLLLCRGIQYQSTSTNPIDIGRATREIGPWL